MKLSNFIKNTSPQFKKVMIIIVILFLLALIAGFVLSFRAYLLANKEIIIYTEDKEKKAKVIEEQLKELEKMSEERRKEGDDIPISEEEIKKQLEILNQI